jgi:hypothetical protein
MALLNPPIFQHTPKPSDCWDTRPWAFKTPKERQSDEDNLENYLLGYLAKLTGSLQREYEPVMPVAVGKGKHQKGGHHRGPRVKK